MIAALLLASTSALSGGPAGGAAAALPVQDGVEAFVEARAEWLAELTGWIEEGGAAPFVEGAELEVPADQRALESGGDARLAVSVGPQEAAPSAAEVRSALTGGQRHGGGARVKVKVVSASPSGESFDLGLRVESRAAGTPPRWQSVARASVSLVLGDDGAWRGRSVRVESFETAVADRPLFVERTAGVLGAAPEAARILSVGMDRWAQRLDDPALSAWFGHQGVAAGDVNGDGRPDLLVAMPSGLPNMLLVQQPDGSVRDVATELGLAWLDDSKGVLLADLDGDGRDDAVTSLGHVLVVQLQDPRGDFRVAGWGAAPDEAPFYGISAADVDGDGDLDLFGARYVSTRYADTVPVPFEDARNGPSNVLFRNDRGALVDVTEAAGLAEDGGRFSLQGSFVDHDLDGDPDLYVVNDFGRNQLFVNEGGRFTDRAAELGVEDQGAGMGASWADFDLDGDLDLYVTNMFSSAGRRVAFQEGFAPTRSDEERAGIRRLSLGNSLLVREGERFVDRSDERGVRMGRWAWGAIFVDLDADGRDDLFSPAGFLTGPEPGDL